MRILTALMSMTTAVMVLAPSVIAQDQGNLSAREKSVRAATAFADALWSKGSPENLMAVRIGLNAAVLVAPPPEPESSGRGLRAATVPATTSLERDLQYRENAEALLGAKNRIWKGQRTSGFPQTVSIQGHGGLCSGTLIAPNAVLTAAHCDCEGVNQRVTFGDSADQPDLVVPVDHKANFLGSCPSNPNTLGDRELRGRDVAILILKRSVPIPPIALAASEKIDAAQTIRAVGYGKTETGAIGVKMEVDVPIATAGCTRKASTGRPSDEEVYGCAPGAELVAGNPVVDRDSCNGDSGGPAFVESSSSTPERPRWLLAGSTSRAVPNAVRICGDGGIYERLDGAILDWLRSQALTPTVEQ